MMGLCPPQSYQEVWQLALQGDLNHDGCISMAEMFLLFKQLQGINGGMMSNQVMSMGW